MSEGRVRLRLQGEPEALTLPVREGEARVRVRAPSIAIVAAVRAADADAFATMIAEAASGRAVIEQRAAVRAKAGAETIDGVLRASSDALPGALDALIAHGADDALRVVIGAPFVALARADLSVLITSGSTPVQWDPQLRAMRDRFELVIPEPRPGLARALVARL
ncbi:hypothetical protein [Sandaracinus amylolyticus]|uniref:Uncharacterized protein n=1 Tax=Sandaracinus amylolyticus TaxID=927083 RepID=A0A0F6W5G5_9BACT|nr:hypothetical protein [Sandaracinus amylolyticus]AKF07802.1 hypothetical protein DB32_004951 [Sandaracinus amylolyticus]